MSAEGIWGGLKRLRLTEDDKLQLEELREDRPKSKALVVFIDQLVRIQEDLVLTTPLSVELEGERDIINKKARAEGARQLLVHITQFLGNMEKSDQK